MRHVARKIIVITDQILLAVANWSRFGSLFYSFFRLRFVREQIVVLTGRIAYRRGPSALGSDASLRRAIHRLEKGLIMRPRHQVFAVDYIESAVTAYERALHSVDHDAEEILWARDVLREYFAVVRKIGPIVAAERKFISLKFPLSQHRIREITRTPFKYRESSQNSIDFELFLALCRRRRSIRWFLSDPVPPSLVENAISAALAAPSACNRQPFFFRYFDNVTDASRVASIAMGTTGYAHQIPALLVLLGDWSCFEDERDRHLPYIDGSLAAMQLMLALETLGLASCPINWPDVESLERKMDRELNLPPYVRPIMLIAVGYPDPEGGVAYSAKKPPAIVLQRGG